MAATIGKKELCEALGWSRPKLDRRLKSDGNFPVAGRGDQSGGWQFDLQRVRDYLGGVTRPKAKRQPKAVARAAAPEPEPLPIPRPVRRSADHAGEATAKQRKDEADAQLKEMKVAAAAGSLVPREEVEQVLQLICAGLGNDLDALPEEIVKACGLPTEALEVIRKKIDAARENMVMRGGKLIGVC